MNYLYFFNICKLTWSDIKQKKILSIAEQHNIETYRLDQDKIRSLLGKMLLLYVLKKHNNYQNNVLPCFSYNEYKKPNIDFIQGGFNISHAGDWVICGYNTEGDIGVDIEKIVPVNFSDYREVLTASEYQRTQHDKTFNFFQLWTLKEAIMKADGRGIFLPATSIEIPTPFKNNTQIRINNTNWFLYSCLINKNYYLAVASITTLAANNIYIKQLFLKGNGLF